MKFSIGFIFVLVALAAILSATFAVRLRQTALFEQESKRDRVAVLVLQYIIANDDQWPPDWESLKPYYRIHPNDDYDFQQLTEEFTVDFSLDAATLHEIANDPERARLFAPIKRPSTADQPEPMNGVQIDPIIKHYQISIRRTRESKKRDVALLIESYIRQHEGQWPPNWDSLQTHHAAWRATLLTVMPGFKVWAFEELTEEITVDFSLDAATLHEVANDPKKSRQFQPIKLPPTAGSVISDYVNRVLYPEILKHYRDVPAESRRFP